MTTPLRRLPAEWEPQDAVQLTLPHPGTDWAYMLTEVLPCFTEIVNAITLYQQVILVADEDWLRTSGFEPERSERIAYAHLPTNDTWARDHSAIVVEIDDRKIDSGKGTKTKLSALANSLPLGESRGGATFEVIDFVFNGWGLKFPANHDNLITKGLHDLSFFNGKHRYGGMALEGGALESDGAGTLLTTSECLLSPNRNPHMSKAQVETRLKQLFGLHTIHWLHSGYLAGDDTDSHIDTLARFCSTDTICYVQCLDTFDEHYPALAAMETELKALRQANGKPYNLIALPMTDAIYDSEGNRLPATYANFLFINGAILLPIYMVPQDAEAIAIMERLFPQHKIHAIDCRTLIEQHGSLHCVTMQYPRGSVNKLIFE